MNFGTGSFENNVCDYFDECSTKPPTPSPSIDEITTDEPTPSPITPAPTPCEVQVFFYNGIECSNEFFIADAMAYSSLNECCDANFGSGSGMVGRCDYTDTCNTEQPTPSPVTDEPTPNPTPKPTPSPVTPSPTPCEAQIFFFDGNSCSNEFYIADTSSYSSVVACCDANFGSGSFMDGSCDYVDMCSTEPPSPGPTPSPVTPSPTPCEAQVFFFTGNMCSNEVFIADASSYISLESCCDMNFGSGSLMNGGCNYIDMCNTLAPTPPEIVTPEPTPSPVTPAPTPCEDQVFFFDGVSCSNEFFVADASSYDSLSACCSANFGSMSDMTGECQYTDICNPLPPTQSPFITNSPTSGSTPTVSTEVTGPPTMPDRTGDGNDQGEDNDNRNSQQAWFTIVGNNP